MLRTADRALCSAYVDKSGMTEEEALQMMEHTTFIAFSAFSICSLVGRENSGPATSGAALEGKRAPAMRIRR